MGLWLFRKYLRTVATSSKLTKYSYPSYFWPQSENWVSALMSLGIPEVFDPNEGLAAGGYFLPSNVDPINQTRSDARRAYYDPSASRPNLDVLANTLATRIIFNSGNTTVNFNSTGAGPQFRARATAVEYASGPDSPRQTVFASKEVILAAGALHSPQLLQISGIGPAALLQSLSIPVVQDLIGVGNNLQDHCIIHLDYHYQEPGLLTPYSVQYNQSLNDACEAEFLASRTGPWAGRPSTALAFLALSQIADDTYTMINATRAGGRYYPDGYDAALQAGYELQFKSTLDRLGSNSTPAYENLNNNAGGLDISLMHPLSRGRVMVASSDPFEAPTVDPRWLLNPLDLEIMVRAIQFNQQILDTPAIQELMPSYFQVSQNASVEEITAILRSQVTTEFHYSGTCAMMPQELGGVVDSNLIVYGTQNLRVVDTSMFPLLPAAHLQAPMFAIAEKVCLL
jgi:choline dehydrogenase